MDVGAAFSSLNFRLAPHDSLFKTTTAAGEPFNMLSISPLVFFAIASNFALGQDGDEYSELQEMPKASGDSSGQQEAWAFITSPDETVSGAVQLTNIPGNGTKFVLEVDGLPDDAPDGFKWHVHASPV